MQTSQRLQTRFLAVGGGFCNTVNMTTPMMFQEPVEETPDIEPEEILSDEPTEDAPYGYTVDRITGERRPKKRAGRRSKSDLSSSGDTPTMEDLKGRPIKRGEDVAPSTPKREGIRGGRRKASVE